MAIPIGPPARHKHSAFARTDTRQAASSQDNECASVRSPADGEFGAHCLAPGGRP